jgi:serine O-acetyltransferase
VSAGPWQAARADIERYLMAHPRLSARTATVILFRRGLQAVLVYRLGAWLRTAPSRPLAWPLVLPLSIAYLFGRALVRRGYGIRIEGSADIGPGLYIGHFGGIELRNCVIGEHCCIGQQVRIVGPRPGEGPTIGSRVWIGGHSRVESRVSIGDDATIGAGSVVVADVPPKTLVAGAPARTVSRCYDNSPFLAPRWEN